MSQFLKFTVGRIIQLTPIPTDISGWWIYRKWFVRDYAVLRKDVSGGSKSSLFGSSSFCWTCTWSSVFVLTCNNRVRLPSQAGSLLPPQLRSYFWMNPFYLSFILPPWQVREATQKDWGYNPSPLLKYIGVYLMSRWMQCQVMGAMI